MSIIIENQNVKADIHFEGTALEIAFPDEPAMALGECVVIDLMQRSIGVIYQNTYHHIGDLPEDMEKGALHGTTFARLQGTGARGQGISLRAPLKIVSHTHTGKIQ